MHDSSMNLISMERLIQEMGLLSTGEVTCLSTKPSSMQKEPQHVHVQSEDSSMQVEDEDTSNSENEEEPEVVEQDSPEVTAAKQRATAIIRANMVQIIAKLLQSKSTTDAFGNKLPSMATALDNMLYDRAPSLHAYCDMKSLQRRIHEALQEHQRKRRLSRLCGGCHPPQLSKGQSRDKVLREVLQGPKYDMAQKLVREIKLHKVRRVAASSCWRPFPYRAGDAVAVEPKWDTTQDSEEEEDDTVARDSLPPPVAALFFNTPLVDVYERYPVARLKDQNWNMLLGQAIQNLRAYKAYLKDSN